MPLRAVVYQADLLNHGRKLDHHTPQSFFGSGSYDDEDYSRCDPIHLMNNQAQNCPLHSKSWNQNNNIIPSPSYIQKKGSHKVRPRRRRLGGGMSEAEVMHHQRLTHIAVERNRRKQVNEYLSTLQSLMPHSYANKGDQASIVGGAIDFVKELEQKLQWLERYNKCCDNSTTSGSADVEVSVADSFANLKIRAISTGEVNNQILLRILEHLDECKFTVLHLTVCSVDHVIIYTICMKVEDECNLTTRDEIAYVVHQLLFPPGPT